MASRKLKFAGGVLLAVLLVGILIGIWTPKVALFSLPDGEVRILDTPAIVRKIQGISQLVTVKYVVEKVVVIEDAKWYGENRVMIVAHGIAKAGIDLGRLQPGDVEVDGTTLRVFMPSAEITDIYLDEEKTQVLEHSTGLLREFDKELQQNARRNALGDIRRTVLANGIIRDAEERAKLQLETLFLQLGFERVEVLPHSGLSMKFQ